MDGSVQGLTSDLQLSELLYEGQSKEQIFFVGPEGDPEKLSRRDLVVESCWMLEQAGLYRRPDSGSSWR